MSFATSFLIYARSEREHLLSEIRLRLHQMFHCVYRPVTMKSLTTSISLTEADIDRIVEMAWEDRTPFDAIEAQFGLAEQDVIKLMRRELKQSSWQRWRARVQGRSTKHATLSAVRNARFKSAQQRVISFNKISKR